VRTIAQIDAELARLKAEKRALKPVISLGPGFKRSRTFRPEGEGQRQPRETDSGFLAYLRRQPCDARHMGGCSGPIQAAHIRFSDVAKGSVNPGMGRKNHDRNATALCEGHHIHGQHRTNERAWWAAIGRDTYDTAAAHFSAYQRSNHADVG